MSAKKPLLSGFVGRIQGRTHFNATKRGQRLLGSQYRPVLKEVVAARTARMRIPRSRNAVSRQAFRPLDILPSRKGLTWQSGKRRRRPAGVADCVGSPAKKSPGLLV